MKQTRHCQARKVGEALAALIVFFISTACTIFVLAISVVHPILFSDPGYSGKFMSSLESGRPSGGFEQPKPPSRPLAVTLGVVLLTANFLMAFVGCLIWGISVASPFPPPGTNILWALFCLWPVFFVLFLILVLFIPLWFLYRRKNWARWYFLIFACLSLATLFMNEKVTAASAAIVLVNAIATVALFLPSSDRWFSAREKGPPPVPN